MKTACDLFEDAILEWRNNKGVGTALIPYPLNDKVMVLGILERVYSRSPTCETLIITDTFKERNDLIEFITNQEDEENNKEFKHLAQSRRIAFLTANYVNNNNFHCKPVNLCICYHLTEYEDKTIKAMNLSKFKLAIINKLPTTTELNSLYSFCPLLSSFKAAEIEQLKYSTPVEEILVGVTIPADSDDNKLLKYYDEYIATSINVFGSLETIDQARVGNPSLNISSNQICYSIAKDNGWNEHMDMSVEINVLIDAMYSPAALKERANSVYEIIRNRNQFLSDYDKKLEAILDIINDNPNSKILIINKRGKFASKVTDYINNNSETNICGNYHNDAEPIPAVTIDGEPIYYKSGSKRGERRYYHADAQKTLNQSLFNLNRIRVLSMNNAPDKDLSVSADIIIITSPQCDDLKSYIYRLSNVVYDKGIIKLYSIFVKNSVEEQKLQNKFRLESQVIVNNCEKDVSIENNSDFVIVD